MVKQNSPGKTSLRLEESDYIIQNKSKKHRFKYL